MSSPAKATAPMPLLPDGRGAAPPVAPENAPDWELIAGKLGRIADVLEPLAAVAPTLIELAGTYTTGKELAGGAAVAAGHAGRFLERVGRWVITVGGALAILWELRQGRWLQVAREVLS